MDEELEMEAMNLMAGPAMGGGDEMATTTVEVPNYALAAVTELIALLEEQMMGGGMEAQMGADMGMGMDEGMAGLGM